MTSPDFRYRVSESDALLLVSMKTSLHNLPSSPSQLSWDTIYTRERSALFCASRSSLSALWISLSLTFRRCIFFTRWLID